MVRSISFVVTEKISNFSTLNVCSQSNSHSEYANDEQESNIHTTDASDDIVPAENNEVAKKSSAQKKVLLYTNLNLFDKKNFQSIEIFNFLRQSRKLRTPHYYQCLKKTSRSNLLKVVLIFYSKYLLGLPCLTNVDHLHEYILFCIFFSRPD